MKAVSWLMCSRRVLSGLSVPVPLAERISEETAMKSASFAYWIKGIPTKFLPADTVSFWFKDGCEKAASIF